MLVVLQGTVYYCAGLKCSSGPSIDPHSKSFVLDTAIVGRSFYRCERNMMILSTYRIVVALCKVKSMFQVSHSKSTINFLSEGKQVTLATVPDVKLNLILEKKNFEKVKKIDAKE